MLRHGEGEYFVTASKTIGSNYKQTLNFPQTDFPMKANLAVRELDFVKRWQDTHIHIKQLEQNKNAPSFCLTDGPPYANGDLHMGHALNKILKDVIVKFKSMSGYKALFVPGWDCHGLPIEHLINKRLENQKDKALDHSKSKLERNREVRELCRREAKKWIQKQKEQFVRFGVLADWQNPYLTLEKEYEAEEIRTLAKLIQKGVLYRDTKAVHWCWALQTALAEAEIEYRQHKSPAIYLKFYIKDGVDRLQAPIKLSKKIAFAIWTTTPWTIPSNRAHAVHPELDYSVYQLEQEYIVIADSLKSSFENTTSKKLQLISGPFKGKQLEGITTYHAMYSEQISPIILSGHVTMETGTGVVHIAPGHGEDDFLLGKKYGLEIFSPVDEFGKYTGQVPQYKSVHIFDANPRLIEQFQKSGHLIYHQEIEHSYPHCWRSKTPLIFRTTQQWFIAMDHKDHPIRKMALDAIKNVRWFPDWGERRISAMIADRPDWCLSRQRLWGVPLPIFYCDSCSQIYYTEASMNKIADAMEAGEGIETYWSKPVSDFLPSGAKCSQCGKKSFHKGVDILDVWFDSGVCWASVQKKHPHMTFPADLYLEGSDQHRGWFHTSLLTSVAVEKKAPFKDVLTHGFVMFSKGVKMSKSQGNIVDPQDIIKEKGAEILRLWAVHEDYTQDIGCSPESFARITETYRRLRNTMRFLLGNLNDFLENPIQNEVPYHQMKDLDQWILHKLNQLVGEITKAYEDYCFYKIYHLLNNFFNVEMSSLYLDIIKDRLYVSKVDSLERRSAQTALFQLTHTLIRLMAPILSFLSEEVYEFLVRKKDKESVFLMPFPKVRSEWDRNDLEEKYKILLAIRKKVSKKIEELRNAKQIRSSLEVKVCLDIDEKTSLFQFLALVRDELLDFFIVSEMILGSHKSDQIKSDQAEFKQVDSAKNLSFSILEKELEKLEVIVSKADGDKCVRCWRFSCQVGDILPDICPRCAEVVR